MRKETGIHMNRRVKRKIHTVSTQANSHSQTHRYTHIHRRTHTHVCPRIHKHIHTHALT